MWKAAIAILSLSAGMVRVDQVWGLDQAPLATLTTVGSAQSKGTPCGMPLTAGVCGRSWTTPRRSAPHTSAATAPASGHSVRLTPIANRSVR